MRILVINPNTSDLVTERIAGVVRKIAGPTTEANVTRIPHGPEALESYYDESMAAPYVLECVMAANQQGYDAIIIAAFCDPAIEAAKEVSTIPVYSLEETSLAVALLLGNKFGIITEQKHKVAVKQQHVRKHGLESRFASVRPMNMGVLELAGDREHVMEVGIQVGRRMVEEDGAEVIILGCASLAGYAEDLEHELGVPVLDPVSVTFKVVEALTAIGVRHSKIGLYARPASTITSSVTQHDSSGDCR
jgi:allantoin racemase